MKISELNTKSFLSGAGAAAKSYVLVNYEDNSVNAPVTYKASIDELSKAVANNLGLLYKDDGTLKKLGVNNGAYSAADETVSIADISFDTNERPIIYNTSTQSIGYLAANNSDVIALELGGGGGSGGSGDTPFVATISQTPYNYLFIDPATGTGIYTDEYETLNALETFVFYDAQSARFVSAGGSVITPPPPYEIRVSDNPYAYMLYSSGVTIYTDEDQNIYNLGHPVFYDETTNKVGYYTANGSFIDINA